MKQVAALVIGAIVGTALRLALDTVIPHDASQFPLSTIIINIVGAFALGLLVARLWPVAPAWARAGLGAGLIGTFTTFSAFALSLAQLAARSEWVLAGAYLLGTMVLGLGAAIVGLSLGRRRAIDLENE